MASRFLTEFKSYMELDITDTSNDSIASISLNTAEKYMEKACNITIEAQDKDLITDGDGTTTLFIDAHPIDSINSVTIDAINIPFSSFYIKNSNMKYLDGSTFSSGIQNIAINISIGYSDDVIPEDIKLAIFKMAEKYYVDTVDNRSGVNSYSADIKMGESYRHRELPDTVKAIISFNKRIVL